MMWKSLRNQETVALRHSNNYSLSIKMCNYIEEVDGCDCYTTKVETDFWKFLEVIYFLQTLENTSISPELDHKVCRVSVLSA